MILNQTMLTEKDLDLEAGGHQEPPLPEPSQWKYKDFNFEDDDLLFVAMDDTGYCLVDGCDSNSSSYNSDCRCNEIATTHEKAESICNSTQIGKLYKKRTNLFLKSFLQGKYVTASSKWIYLEDTMSAKISIYFHVIMPRGTHSGVPVLLNFTGTENYFSCTRQEEEKILTVQPYDTNKLQCICANDTEKWSLVFYMSQSASGLWRFESALYRGWFINTGDSETVKIQRGNTPGNTSFILIESETTETILHCKQFLKYCNKSC